MSVRKAANNPNQLLRAIADPTHPADRRRSGEPEIRIQRYAAQFVIDRHTLMSFGLYSIGFLIVIAGVAYFAHLMHIPQAYIVATVVILVGIGLLTAVKNTRGKDPN